MTADKMLKRLIRARIAKTGESYVVARRQLLAKRDGGSADMQDVVQYTDDAYGFSLSVPREWESLEPDMANSPFEVARFLRVDGAERRGALVFVRPAIDGTTLASAVAETKSVLAGQGFANFEEMSTIVAGRDGARLRCDKPLGDKSWTVFHYFAVVDDETHVLVVASSDADADNGMLRHVADSYAVRVA